MDRMIDGFLLSRCEPGPWSALLVPHAGWVYSGELAFRGFQRVAIPETVIFFAPKHTRPGARWAVAPHDGWAVPGRTVPGDAALARELVAAVPGLELDAQAHRTEHAIEVQLPFLSRLAPETRMVGIVLAQSELEELQQLGAHLADFLGQREDCPLLVISSDLNHFAAETENRRLDHIAVDALGKCDPDALYETVHRNRISMCGVYAAVAVFETLRILGQLSRAELVGYTNSAATSGDTSRVVGYASMVFG
jgi:AmmeMemoRadiSam system protein B